MLKQVQDESEKFVNKIFELQHTEFVDKRARIRELEAKVKELERINDKLTIAGEVILADDVEKELKALRENRALQTEKIRLLERKLKEEQEKIAQLIEDNLVFRREANDLTETNDAQAEKIRVLERKVKEDIAETNADKADHAKKLAEQLKAARQELAEVKAEDLDIITTLRDDLERLGRVSSEEIKKANDLASMYKRKFEIWKEQAELQAKKIDEMVAGKK